MQIHEAAVGKQLRIHGNVVCVPADICTTVNMLPRTTSDFETVAVQLKRKSQYHHPFYRATACNATHGIAVGILSVRPSVRPSDACIVTKLNNALRII